MQEVSYWLYGEEFQKHVGSVGAKKAVEMEIMDDKQKVWKTAKIEVYDEPVKGSQPAGLLGPFSEPYDVGNYHIKVLEILPSPLED